MQFLKFLQVAWSAAWQIWSWIKELDATGVERYSDLWWWSLRFSTEQLIARLRNNEDRGWRRLIQFDNQLFRGLSIYLKSECLSNIYASLDKGISAQQGAKKKLDQKTPTVYPAH